MFLFVLLLLIQIITCDTNYPFSITVQDIISNGLYVTTNINETVRVFSLQHADGDFQLSSMKSNLKYMFSVIPNMPFFIHFEESNITSLPYVAIYTEAVTSSKQSFLNFKLPFAFLSCKYNQLIIHNVTDKKDSCVDIHVQYKGEGEMYLLARRARLNIPNEMNVIHEGIYLGNHHGRIVNTTYCSLTQDTSYNFYLTAIDKNCIHPLTIHSFKTEKWTLKSYFSRSSLYEYVNSLSNEESRLGIKYRRYSTITALPSHFDEIPKTNAGVLLKPLHETISILNQKHGVIESNEILPEPASFTIEWFSNGVNNGVFRGKFYVLGKGNVYILCTDKKTVSIQDVYHFGENVGFYDQDAVEVTITDLQGDKNFVYVVIGYGEQFYGPFSISASN